MEKLADYNLKTARRLALGIGKAGPEGMDRWKARNRSESRGIVVQPHGVIRARGVRHLATA